MFVNIFLRTGSPTLLEAGGGTDSDALELMDDGELHMNQKLGQFARKMDTIFSSPSVSSYLRRTLPRDLLKRKTFRKNKNS